MTAGRKVHYGDAEAGTPTACGRKQGENTLVMFSRNRTTCKNCRRCKARRKVIWQERADRLWREKEERLGAWDLTHVERLRRRDGDTCWLCRMPIDFTLTGADEVWAASVDHVVPRSMGGGSEFGNKKLAHRQCNSSREALYPHTLPGGAQGRVVVRTLAR